uniref:Terminase large subunit n=1 Tax=Siphoviridae sp. ctxMM9 TaxID=2827973 RepID=A0A8S5T5S9_9CAUD|nr:MAG TPA: terminase large subunit [Siphoviridae sp. ctxMM9]
MGGTYLVPVLAGLQDKNFIRDLKLDGTFNQSSFDREYKMIVFFKYCELLGHLYYLLNYNAKLRIYLNVNVKN